MLPARTAATPRPGSSLFLFVFLVACWLHLDRAVVSAQPQTAALQVVVTSADDDRPLQGANIVLAALVRDVSIAGAAGENGALNLSRIPPGRYHLTVSFIGFETYRDTLALHAGERRTLDVQLPIQEQALDEVRVEAERGAARRAAGLQTVRVADLDRIPTPGPTGDLAAYLQTLPGVVSAGDRGGQLFIRGGTPSQNLVLVDGLPIVKPFHISSLYSAFPQDVVERVDVHAGGFSAKYMGAISSVLDVSLRNGNMESVAGSASISPFIVSSRLEGPIDPGRSSFLAMARHSVIEETAGPLLARDVPLRFYDLIGRYSMQNERAACSVTGMHTFDRGRLDTQSNTVLAWTNTVAGGQCLLFAEDLDRSLTVSGGYSRYRNEAGTRSAPERAAGLRKGYFSVDREQRLSWGELAFGVRSRFTQFEYDLDEKFVALDARNSYVSTLQAYTALDWEWGDRLSVSPSIGTHFTGRLDAATLEPRLRLAVRPDGTDDHELNVAVGRYNQIAEGITDERDAGTVFTIWVPSLQDDALPEALHGILGYRHRFGSGVEASIEGYVKDMSDIPVPLWTPVARFNTRTTLADGSAYGADARVEVDRAPFYLFLGYGWSRVTYQAASQSLGSWVEGPVFEYAPAHDRRHQINAVMSYEWAGFTTSVSWEFGSGRPFTQAFGFDLSLSLVDFEQYPTTSPGTALLLYDRPYGARLPSYHRLDASIERSFDLSARLTLTTQAGAINAYDRGNVFYFDTNALRRVNQSPFLPYASLRVTVD